MIRITILRQTPEEVLLHLSGWIQTPPEVELVAQEGNRCLQHTHRLVLDLSEVGALHEEGVALFKGWQAAGRLHIGKWSSYIEHQLQFHGLIPTPAGEGQP